MCANYQTVAVRNIQQLELLFPAFDYVSDAYPASLCPIIVAEQQNLAWRQAIFGLVPEWANDPSFSKYTYNARLETVATKPSYKSAWRNRQFALIPMQAFYEPRYLSEKSVRWKIERLDQAPFTVAAIWDSWSDHLDKVCSFSMLTINADHHPLMKQFHKPLDEKRSLVVIPPERRTDWLHADHKTALEIISEIPVDQFHAVAAPRLPASRLHNFDLS